MRARRKKRRDPHALGIGLAVTGGAVAVSGLLLTELAAIGAVLIGVGLFAIGCLVMAGAP